MKGRSQQQQQRLPALDPLPYLDDWVDGSWTVDCSCGVTFDDGEEMVSCDECGVWVHTRCARYVRGDPSFACHNCKTAKRLRSSSSVSLRSRFPSPRADHAAVPKPDDEEETEVAQLLAELPTKTDQCPPRSPSSGPHRPPFWAHIPMEDRVHVQGVPGGDPALFQGLSSVFSSQLWRCTGYTPKKFNFHYREFPCWEDEDEDGEEEDEGDNPASRGADVLFSLSKEIFPYVPMHQLDAFQRQRPGKKDFGSSRSLNCRKKDRNRLAVLKMQPPAKRRREDSREGKDRRSSGKKKARNIADNVAEDSRMKGSVPLSSSSNIVHYKDVKLQAKEAIRLNGEDQTWRKEMLKESNYATLSEGRGNNTETENTVGYKNHTRGSSNIWITDKNSFETVMDQMEDVKAQISLVDAASQGEASDLIKISGTYEVSYRAANGLKEPKDEGNFDVGPSKGSSSNAMGSESLNPVTGDRSSCYNIMPDTRVLPDVKDPALPETTCDETEIKTEQGDEQLAENSDGCPGIDGNLHGPDTDQLKESSDQVFENKQDKCDITSLSYHEQKLWDINKESNAGFCVWSEVEQGMSSGANEQKQHQHRLDKSAGEVATEKGSLGLGNNLENFDQPTNMPSQCSKKLTPVVLNTEAGIPKVYSISSMPDTSRSSLSLGPLGADACLVSPEGDNLVKPPQSITYAAAKKESATTSVSGEETVQQIFKDSEKGHADGSLCSGPESSQTTRIIHSSASKLVVSGAEETLSLSPSNVSTKERAAATLGSGDAATSSQFQAAPIKTKATSSNSCPKNEKIYQQISCPTSKASNNSMLLHLPASANATTLSDEELALLLHQELNSSPRVPRVPRVRQAIGIQFATATSMSGLSRRTSTASVKDQASVFRRKNKDDASRDRAGDSHELNDETIRKNRVQSSPGWQHQESSFATDRYAKKYSHNKYSDTLAFTRKNSSVLSAESATSGPSSFEASEKNVLPMRSSPKDAPKDDSGHSPSTLPGLIHDIMSKDRHITYEKLCDAVRLHWHDLRKPNGERYAYPSHVHAVHDCLRNRSEWAHLIDQALKTNSSKKRRKADFDMWQNDSVHKRAKNKADKEVVENNVDSHREDFPKGKRNARKRRPLESRWRDGKESRKIQNHDAVSEEDRTAFSYSSHEGNENLSSDEEIQGAEPHATGTDLSSSSLGDSE